MLRTPTGSVRNNILFGLPLDVERYNTVITACALDRDFALFPNGDGTQIGERGVTLSGGQKARVRYRPAFDRPSSRTFGYKHI